MGKMKSTPCFFLALLVGTLFISTTTAAGFDYGDALDKSLLFFEAQRSGKLPSTQRVTWRGDSGLKDGYSQGVDLVGGYYDAGDHVKFGLPMAFSVTMLSWAAIEFRKEITDLNQMGNTLWAIRWGTDYFLKAHPQANVLWGQVGDGDSDHYCWERAEDMTTPRTAYKIDASHPGSDLAGETAAALAAASIAFKPYNSSYSSLLLVHATQLFTFADEFRGSYDDSISSAQNFYTSSGYLDELLWAAAWLYQATNDDYYLKYAVDGATSMGGTGWGVREFSWDTKYAGVQILLSKVLLEGKGGAYTNTLKQYQAKANYFACACVQKNDGYNVATTPGGLLYVRGWNNMQYASSAAFLLAVYSDYLSAANAKLTCPEGVLQPQELLNFAQSQADYILGKNPKSMSYLVGYGTNYPTHVHHRGASIPSIQVLQSAVQCVQGFDQWYYRPLGNPNVINGALVGGPDSNDNFSDERSNYEETEPTLTGTAPLVGLFSKLQGVNGVPVSYQKKRPELYQTTPSPTSHKAPAAPNTKTPGPSPRKVQAPKSGGPYSYKTTAPNTKSSDVPVEFIHSITSRWDIAQTTYYRHRVVIKNKSQKPITDLKLEIQKLSGPLWGLSPTSAKNVYELPQWQKVIKPGAECVLVYIQGGPQAKFKVLSYH